MQLISRQLIPFSPSDGLNESFRKFKKKKKKKTLCGIVGAAPTLIRC
jgi:hypothetical protein